MANAKRSERAQTLILKLAADFIERDINPKETVTTVTIVELSPGMKEARVFISVWPDSREPEVLGLLKEARRDFYEYMKKNFKIKYMPSFEFRADGGERARQKIEEILKNNK